MSKKFYIIGLRGKTLVCFLLVFLLLGTIVCGNAEEVKTIMLNGKVYNLIPLSQIPTGKKVIWVNSIEEAERILSAISNIKVTYKKDPQKKILIYDLSSRTGYGSLYDSAEYVSNAGPLQYGGSVVLVGSFTYNYDTRKVISVNANVVASSGMFTEVSTSCSYGTVGSNTAWARGQANFRVYIGIQGVGITIGTFSLSVSDSVSL